MISITSRATPVTKRDVNSDICLSTNSDSESEEKRNPPEAGETPAPSLSQKGWSAQPQFLVAPDDLS